MIPRLQILLPIATLALCCNAKPQDKPKEIRFEPTTAQKNYPRVKAARERRHEGIRKLFQKHGIDYPPKQVLLRTFKHEDRLELWVLPVGKKKYTLITTYEICCKSGVLGPKRKRGDLQVPEGFYRVIDFNPWSSFLLSMKINYPNPSDTIRGHPRDPGGLIYIHGSCVTIGCIKIEQLYLIFLDTMHKHKRRGLVHIFPARMNEQGMRWLKEKYQDQPELIRFWKEIEVGFDKFEEDHIPNRFIVGKNGAYRFR
jgi:murein L,D-transpeptidase YafK